jgi:predicted dehydrogenase
VGIVAAPQRMRYAIVGTGSRAAMYVNALATDYRDSAQIVAFCDTNPVRMAVHNRLLERCSAPPAATYPPDGFRTMLDTEAVDRVLVTSVDRTHDGYLVAALEAGRDVVTEKPMTIDAPRCRRVLDAVRRTGRQVTVTFNYRYNPVHEAVRRVLAAGEIGEIGSVHFEWLLDVRHGADYFRRWHRDKANSGGLMVHKASHHFDLVNWWLAARPQTVFGLGRLFFYGEAGARHGYDRGYARAHGDPAAADDPFALHLARDPQLTALYLDAEGVDGYLRDRNVFAPGVTIEDDMAVLVRYDTGATMTYHLTAYSPWEGYRVMVNGSAGRLELEVVEGAHARLTVHPFWTTPRPVELPAYTREGHGGADARMAAALFGPPQPDPLGRHAGAGDGAQALLTGIAANESFRTGAPVAVGGLL